MSKVRIRRAVPDDCLDIQRMIVAIAKEGISGFTPKVSVGALKEFVFGPSPRLVVWIAQLDDGAVGALVGTPIVSTWRGTEGLYVVDLYVEARARGSGIASSLLACALRDGNYQFVKLEVASRNSVAVSFYEHHGFVTAGDEQTMFLELPALTKFLSDSSLGRESERNSASTNNSSGFQIDRKRESLKSLDIQQRRLAATPRGVNVMGQFYVARADNASLWDAEGREYIDFAAGIAVLNTGHRHPRVVAAIREQLDLFTHTAYQVVPYEILISLAERLNTLVPIHAPTKTAFFTTGAEAVENAIKIARHHTGRTGVIAFSGSFHGRTLMTLALTGKVYPYKAGFGPFPPEVFHVPFPSPVEGVTAEDSLSAIARLFKTDIEPQRIAAIIVEPVQGEGGFNVAPPRLMIGLRALCDQHGIVLIADEVQSGFARTGKLFAMEHHGVEPDLMALAKSLAGGMPLSAVTGRSKIMDAPPPGGLGGTYAGNPLAVAAAHAVLDVIDEERLCERAVVLGSKLVARLAEVKKTNPRIVDIRGQGSMVAIELRGENGEPDVEAVRCFQKYALSQGLILLSCGMHGNVIRFLYPLTIPDAVFERALDVIDMSFQEVVCSRGE